MTEATTPDPLAYPSLTLGQKGSALDTARELHAPMQRHYFDYLDNRSWSSPTSALAHYGFEDQASASADGFDLHTFTVCRECSRIEAEANTDADEWSYRCALWPCPSAVALGFSA